MYKLVLLLALAVCAQAHVISPSLGVPRQVQLRTGSRIIHGSPAAPAQFPYQAFLILTKLTGDKFVCGGSLISPTWVLTAGQCVADYVSADVHLGSVRHVSSPVIERSTNLLLHPSYSTIGLRNDIGLIGLPKAVALSINIQPIALPTDPTITYAGREGTVTGFGITQDGGEVSPVLNFAPVRIVTNLVCTASYPANVRDTVLCARGVETGEQGSCAGDSGGPLVLVENGVIKQVGIVSFFNSKGCSSDSPKGYLRPYHYLNWITAVTGITFN